MTNPFINRRGMILGRMAQIRSSLDQDKAAEAMSHGPCTGCRYYRNRDELSWIDGNPRRDKLVCTHLIVSPPRYSVTEGDMIANEETIANARGYGGLCGPEGALFEPRLYLGWWLAGVTLLPPAGGLLVSLIRFVAGI